MSLDFHFDTLHPKVRENRFFRATGQLARENEKKNSAIHWIISKYRKSAFYLSANKRPPRPPFHQKATFSFEENIIFLREKIYFPSKESKTPFETISRPSR